MKTLLVTAGAVHRCCSCYIIFLMFPQLISVLEAEVAGFKLLQTTLVLYLGLHLLPLPLSAYYLIIFH